MVVKLYDKVDGLEFYEFLKSVLGWLAGSRNARDPEGYRRGQLTNIKVDHNSLFQTSASQSKAQAIN